MSSSRQRAPRRREALSKQIIVDTAIEILDAEGEAALTFRSLAARLSTGAGALYHHVSNKDQLLADAATELVAGITDADADAADLKSVLLAIYDAIGAHPWLGAQLVRAPWQTAVLLVFERTGELLQPLGVAEENRFDVASALVNYVIGAAAQKAAGAQLPPGLDREAFLEEVAAQWLARGEQQRLPFVHAIAAQLADHDDRRQFEVGVDLVLAGITTLAR